MKKSKTISISKLLDKAWQVFSKWIKTRDCDWRGYGRCFTCNALLENGTGQAHAGHFHHGKYKKSYFYEKNVHLQCRSCNYFKDGARDIYAYKLIQKYGDGIIQELYKLNKPKDWKRKELEDIIAKYS